MTQWRRIQWIGFILVLVIGSLNVLTNVLSAQARIENELHTFNDEPPALGEACGAGELMPSWVICLHGEVGLRQLSGEVVPLVNIPITATYNGQVVTGTTRLLPGESTPTYGIDISPLEPGYLQAITITAVISNTPITRQIIVAPNFNTQSQQYDVIVADTGALDPGQLWGYVVDFSTNGPAVGASVIAEYGGTSVSVTTTIPVAGEDAIYVLDDAHLATLGVTAGDRLTLTARYEDDVDQKVIVLPSEPLQVNFVTGWKCDGFDPLPRSSSGDALPRSSSGDALPDVACFWGYALVDGIPMAGVDIHYEISGTTYSAVSGDYAGETLPRYGIGVVGGQEISGTVVTATAVYSGATNSESITFTPKSQRTDLTLVDPSVIANFLNGGDSILAIASQNEYLWVGTEEAGVLRWNTNDGSYIQLTTADGLAHNRVNAIAVANDNSLWFGTKLGITHYSPGKTPEWRTFLPFPTNPLDNDIRAIAIANDNSIWFGSFLSGISHYTPGKYPEWELFQRKDDGWTFGSVYALAIAEDNSLWVGADNGIHHYVPEKDPKWESLNNPGGLINNISAIAIENDNSIWFGKSDRGLGTTGGLYHYTPGEIIEWQFFTTTHGLIWNDVYAISIANDDSLWIGARYGVSHYIPSNQEWSSFYKSTQGLAGYLARAISVSNDNSLWVGTETGMSHYMPGQTPEWETYTTNSGGLINNEVHDIVVANDNSLWFGTRNGVNHHYPDESQVWNSFFMREFYYDIAEAKDGSVWFATNYGARHFTPGGDPEWEVFDTDNGLASKVVKTIAIANDGSVWFGSNFDVSHYRPEGNPDWEVFTATNPLVNFLNTIEIANDDSLWFGTEDGVVRYMPGQNPEKEIFTTTHGLINNQVNTIAIANDNSLWFGTDEGVSHYMPGETPEWENLMLPQWMGRNFNQVNTIAIANDNSIWFGSFLNGASRYTPGGNPEWEPFITTNGLADNTVNTIAIANDNTIWFGTDGGVSHWDSSPQKSDLKVKLQGYATAFPNIIITHTISISNNGQRDTTGVSSLTLPPALAYINASLLPSSTAPLVWNLGTITAGAEISFTVTTLVSPDATPGETLTVQGYVSSDIPEAFLSNNNTQFNTLIIDPLRADTRVSIQGPSQLIPDEQVVYHILADNIGGIDAENVILTVSPDNDLQYVTALPAPVSQNPLAWDWGSLPTGSSPMPIVLTMSVNSDVVAGESLSMTASITTTTPDSNPSNNKAIAAVRTSLDDARTLFLVAPERLAKKYGASSILNKLYEVAGHPLAQGVVVDLTANPSVANAYVAWDLAPNSWQAANDVAEAVKVLIDNYTITYPNLRYLVIVGGDDMIPFYRVLDQNPTFWTEQRYAQRIPAGITRAALSNNMLLTDNFYGDRSPTAPQSAFWLDDHDLYLPDFATGRLVETPEEMIAVIDAFLQHDGAITMDSSLVASFAPLTHDLGQTQCDALLADGVVAICTQSEHQFEQSALHDSPNGIWSALHSSHYGLGPLSATEIKNLASYDTTFFASTGCHAGLNTPAPEIPGSQIDYDLIQAVAGQGGTTIGSSSYTYASRFSVGYSEALAAELNKQLLITTTQTLGNVLVAAKQAYYASHANWFDYLDEKVVLPMTLYGLPMLQVNTPAAMQATQSEIASPATNTVVALDNWTAVPITLSNLVFDKHSTEDGTYYSYLDKTLAQDGLPVQPYGQIPLTSAINGRTPRGIILNQAHYTDMPDFNPVKGQSWALGYEPMGTASEMELEEWDRERPFGLGHFDGLHNTSASINLVLGTYHAKSSVERLFDNLELTVLYSDGSDVIPPTLTGVKGVHIVDNLVIQANAQDITGIAFLSAICDDAQGQWQVESLTNTQAHTWQGSCPDKTQRFYIQAVDEAGNVTITEWQAETDAYHIFLPNIVKSYE